MKTKIFHIQNLTYSKGTLFWRLLSFGWFHTMMHSGRFYCIFHSLTLVSKIQLFCNKTNICLRKRSIKMHFRLPFSISVKVNIQTMIITLAGAPFSAHQWADKSVTAAGKQDSFSLLSFEIALVLQNSSSPSPDSSVCHLSPLHSFIICSSLHPSHFFNHNNLMSLFLSLCLGFCHPPSSSF